MSFKTKRSLALLFVVLAVIFLSIPPRIEAASSINVHSPNGGEYWGRGTTHQITWGFSGVAGAKVKVQLYKGTALSKTLAAATLAATGSFTWKIPATFPLSDTYSIRITNIADNGDYDDSDGAFHLVADSLTITSPNGGEKLIAGTTPTITWTYKGNPGPNVTLKLFAHGVLDSTITLSTPTGSAGKGSFGWAIPTDQAFAKDYRVMIHSVTNAAMDDTSNGDFMIATGLAVAWGDNGYGELGDGTNTKSNVPVSVNLLSMAKSISAGRQFGASLLADGTVRTWGHNSHGQLGNGSFDDSKSPVQVTGLSDVTAISAGSAFVLALKSDGTVRSWGENGDGQLGNGNNDESDVPVTVSGLTKVTAVSGGDLHAEALKSDGTVWTWGTNYYGQLGNGTTKDVNKPVKVIGLTGVVAISAGTGHTAALKKDGTVWVWGDGGYGQLGNGTYGEAHRPVQTKNLAGVKSIAAGGFHMVALKSDGTVWTWGLNGKGQLGVGTFNDDRTLPVQVTAISGVMAIAAGNDHTVALKSDGTVWAWGYNSSGQLGNSGFIDSNVPVQVSSLGDVIAIAAGFNHTFALK